MSEVEGRRSDAEVGQEWDRSEAAERRLWAESWPPGLWGEQPALRGLTDRSQYRETFQPGSPRPRQRPPAERVEAETWRL